MIAYNVNTVIQLSISEVCRLPTNLLSHIYTYIKHPSLILKGVGGGYHVILSKGKSYKMSKVFLILT